MISQNNNPVKSTILIRKYSDLIVLIILWLISIVSIVTIFTDNYIVRLPNYLGYGLLMLITILRFLNVNHIKTYIGLMLIIGSFNLLRFTATDITLALTWKPMGNELFHLGFQPISFGLLLFLVFFNFSDAIKLYNKITS